MGAHLGTPLSLGASGDPAWAHGPFLHRGWKGWQTGGWVGIEQWLTPPSVFRLPSEPASWGNSVEAPWCSVGFHWVQWACQGTWPRARGCGAAAVVPEELHHRAEQLSSPAGAVLPDSRRLCQPLDSDCPAMGRWGEEGQPAGPRQTCWVVSLPRRSAVPTVLLPYCWATVNVALPPTFLEAVAASIF